MHIRWEDLGCPRFAGSYPLKTCYVLVKIQHVIVWRAYPEAIFVADWPKDGGGRDVRLTRWYVPVAGITFQR